MFGGFKASLNLFGRKTNKKGLHSELSQDMSVSGAYRTSRDDSFGFRNSFEQSQKTATEQTLQQMRPTKSTNDMTKIRNAAPNLRLSIPEVSRDPRGAEQLDPRNGAPSRKLTKIQEKEEKILEKQRLAEQKAREKKAAQEQAKQEKLRKEREKKEVQQGKVKRRPQKKLAPQPQAASLVAQPSAPYPTNTLDSSISRSSGPPPYSDVPLARPEQNRNAQSMSDSSSNVVFSKPIDTGSWDMISQHRQQTIRPTATISGGGKQNKQVVMDLNYNFGATSQAKDNSDA